MTFADAIAAAPLVHDPDRAARAVAALEAGGAALPEGSLRALIEGVAGCSPYLTRSIERETGFLAGAFAAPPEDSFAALLAEAERAGAEAESMAALMRDLRLAKRRAALFIALCDCGQVWPLERVLRALTGFADTCVRAALGWLLRDAARKGTVELDLDDPVATSGLFVIAMGKHGAAELNYSSDIDLIFFFEHGERDPAEFGGRKQAFNRITRNFVKVMAEQSADGYVFRTDLRLRPDPGSTSPCLSTDAAERYYESMGKNWERAAFIKARVIAGDFGAGARFMETMRPFVWRRYLDFATIEDVRSIKRLIHQQKGHGAIRTAGHDLKLGRGGIREIEFFAQTQQLIAGGREPALQVIRTLDALDALVDHGWVEPSARAELADSYGFLRSLEHRLQMVEDAQTHKMPTDPQALERIAQFAGHESFAALDPLLRAHLERVAARFGALFEEADAGGTERSIFDGDLESALAQMNFADPAKAAETLLRWNNGDIAATKTDRARGILDRIVPNLLASISGASDPDRALTEFDRFLSGLPSGVQILSLFEANPKLLEFLSEICSAAPNLADYLGRNAGVLDAVLGRDFFQPTPHAAALLEEHRAVLAAAGEDFEEVLNASRRWNKERHFRVGAQLLRGIATVGEAGVAYSDLAESCIEGLAPFVTAELARRHGSPPGEGACVLAMGRLGAREMTAASDLDLLVIYDDGGMEASDGPTPLAPTQYYARWTQRLVRAMTAPTAEGAVYEVDMRLRPSGRSGPLATRLAAFERYQAEEAWTWEHMALTRARVVSGPQPLRERVEAAIAEVLGRTRDREKVLADALEMRGRLNAAHPKEAADLWSVKLARGGIVDIDFVLQALLLAEGRAEHAGPCADGAIATLTRSGALDPAAAQTLTEARKLQVALLQITRLSQTGAFSPETAPPALKTVIARAVEAPDFDRVEGQLREAQAGVRAVFAAVFGEDPSA